ncbi:MAG: ATP-dependent Clp protease ATP-binding subunit [Patescibacteria group bacterium]
MANTPEFDLRAKNALATAQQIAIQLGHSHIGSEHLLFGILSQPQDGLAVQITFSDKMSSNELLEAIKQIGFPDLSNKDKKQNRNNLIPEITEEFQLCLDRAIKIAEDHSYNYIGIEHLIYGILDTKESHGLQIMNLQGNNLNSLKEMLIVLFQTHLRESNGMGSTDQTSFGNKKFNGKKKKEDSAIAYFTQNLNEKIEKNPDFAIIGRDRELERVVQILSRREKNNPILVGEPGVGKTAVVEGLAYLINKGSVPEWLQNKKILSLDMTALIAGSIFRGEFEQRLKVLIDEVIASGDIILFIDEIHNVMGAGSTSSGSGPDAANILKPALARGELSVIGATTDEEFRSIIKKDGAFERRFQKIQVDEPTKAETVRIISGVKKQYENYHHVSFPDDLSGQVVNLTERFIPERFFPDKAIDVLDEAMVRTRIASSTQIKKETNDLGQIEKQILDLIHQKNQAILDHNLELSQEFEHTQRELENKLADLNKHSSENEEFTKVTADTIERVVSEISGVPLIRVSSNIFTQINNLSDALNGKIFGQEEAIEEINRALKRSFAGVSYRNGPIGSFLLLGPTGVGKTEMVKLITKELYGDPEKYMLKLDMSEFAERHSLSRLVGAPAGYVGYDDAPQLTEFLRKKPYSVILFDEIEKAHPESLNILLQMLEEGRITDAKGKTASCKHALIFLTSNLGKNQLNRFASKIGFKSENVAEEENEYTNLKDQVMEAVRKAIKPEILGRLSKTIVFKPITTKELEKIVQKELNLLQEHLLTQGKTINFAKNVSKYIVEKLDSKPEYGAREVRGQVEAILSDILAEKILSTPDLSKFKIKVENKELVIE